MEAEAGREHPVEGGRGAAALDVAEDGGAGLLAGAALDLALEPVGDPAEADVAEGVELLLLGLGHAADRRRALGDDDDRREAGLEAAPDQLADLLEVERLLRDQDHVGAAGEPGVEGDPAGVAAHHLDDQDPVVAVGGGVEAVDRLHRDVDRGVEAEGVVGRAEVVVDRLRDADDRDAVLGVKARGGPQRVLAADRDQALDAVALEVLDEPLGVALLLERVGPGGAEDRPPARQDPAHLGHPERAAVGVQRAVPAVAVADELVALEFDPLADDRPDHGVQAGAVATAGEHADPHARRLAARYSGFGAAILITAPIRRIVKKTRPATGPPWPIE